MSYVPVQRIEVFTVAVPKKTLKATPATTALPFTDGVVVWLEVVIPTGHIGQTGIRLAYGGQQVIPDTAGAFITSNGETIHWDLDQYPTGGQWQAQAYNTDTVNAHNFYLRFGIRELSRPDNTILTVAPLALV